MQYSEKYGFYLPSRDGDDIADINQISDNFKIIEENIPSKNDLNAKGIWETIADTTVSETVSQYTITTGGNYKKLLIRIEMTEDTSKATRQGRVQLNFAGTASQKVWNDGGEWIGKTKSGSSTVNGTSNPKVIIFDIDVAENYTMIRVRGEWARPTIDSVGLFPTPIDNQNGIGFGWKDWGVSSVALKNGVTTKIITLYFPAESYPLFAGSKVIVKGVMA